MNNFSENISSVSFIIEQDIPAEETDNFLKWQASIIEASHHFQGYLRTENIPPSSNSSNKWLTVIYFDNADNLTRWLDSETRHRLIRTRQDKLGFYRFVSYKTGFEKWFYQHQNPPKWKQALTVLFGLYPTIILESILFSHWKIMSSWSLASTILVNNIISCFLLTWMVMPLVTRLFNFWLKPPKSSLQRDLMGLLLVIISLGLMLSVFITLTD